MLKTKPVVRKKFLYLILLIICVGVILICGALTGYALPDWDNKISYGANISRIQAQELGLDYGQFYLAMLDDLQVKKIRLPSYWNLIEQSQGNYQWGDLDWDVDQAAQREVEIIMVVGARQPRWPECHYPEWAETLPTAEQQATTLEFIRQTVERYKFQNSIKVWQVENEPYLSVFGECPAPDPEFLQQEVELVQSLDSSRPILITDSGELSAWQRTTKLSDILGISIYDVVWNKYLGYLHYPMAPGHYRRKWQLVHQHATQMIITELQAEPWAPAGLKNMPLADQLKQIDANGIARQAEFVREIGVPEAYFWGVEWWYWLKQQGCPQIWEAGKDYF